jgi:5,10-methylenetetrahydromethanopterin reductase
MPTRFGIWFAGELPVARQVELAVQAEEADLDSVWTAEGYYARDAWTPLVSIGSATSRVLLGTGVVNPFTRHPALLAMSLATLDESSNGRVLAGIGSGERPNIADEMGFGFASPLSAVRETVQILRGMFRGELVHVQGRMLTARNVRLGFKPLRSDIPVYVAAVGPKMCRLAGELGDGVYYPQCSPTYIRQANEHVSDGAREAGRNPGAVDRAAMIISSAAEDSATAKEIPKALLAVLLAVPEGEHILTTNGLDPVGAQSIRDALAGEGMRGAVRQVTAEMVDVLTVSGSPGEVREKLEELIEAGVTHPVLSAIGPYADQTVRAVAAAKKSLTGAGS